MPNDDKWPNNGKWILKSVEKTSAIYHQLAIVFHYTAGIHDTGCTYVCMQYLKMKYVGSYW